VNPTWRYNEVTHGIPQRIMRCKFVIHEEIRRERKRHVMRNDVHGKESGDMVSSRIPHDMIYIRKLVYTSW